MATSGFERIKGDLQCPMCIETFKDPVTLNCGHSFCSNCLNSYIQAHATAVTRKMLPCDVCRHETKVPDPSKPMDQWMEQLMPSFTIKKLVEQLNQPAETSRCGEKCVLCDTVGETTPAVLWCYECEMFLCEKCSKQHRRQPCSYDHHLDKLKSKRKRPLKIMCPKHKEILKFHCRDCSKSICNTCMPCHRTRVGLVLVSKINTHTEKERPVLVDITVMMVRGVEAVIVTDCMNQNVKCYHSESPITSPITSSSSSPSVCKMEGSPWGITQLKDNRVMVTAPGKYQSTSPSTPNTSSSSTSPSVCKMEGSPWGITQLKDNKVMVAIPYNNQLVTLRVTPALMRENTIKTQEKYQSLEMMDNGQLVAGTVYTNHVDVLDVSGNTATIIRTLPTDRSVCVTPHQLTLNRQDKHIIVSDGSKGTVTCMTSEGNIAWTYSPSPGTKFSPCGVTTTQRGDVIVVNESSRRIIVINKSGVHKGDLLTSPDTDITKLGGIYYDDRGYLYITDNDIILIYKMTIKDLLC